MMTNEALAVRYQGAAPEDKQEIISQLWEQNTGILAKMAYRFFTLHQNSCIRAGQTVEDLKQIAFFALCDAAEAFKPEAGYKLTTFLNLSTLKRFQQSVGRWKKNKDGEAYQLTDPLNTCTSLDAPITGKDGSEDSTFGELLEDHRQAAMMAQTDESIFTQQLHAALEKSISDLPKEEQRQVIRLKYFEGLTLDQCGAVMGCSVQNAGATASKAMRLLRHPQRLKYLTAFHDEIRNIYAWHGLGLGSWKESGASGVERAAEKAEWKTQHEFTYQFTADK